jgi:hypothetical protein
MGKRTEQEQAEQAIDAITLRLLTVAAIVSGDFTAFSAPALAEQTLAEIKRAEQRLGIGIRVDG